MSTAPLTAATFPPAIERVAATTRTRQGAVDVLRMAAVIPVLFYHAGVLGQLPALIGMHALIAAAIVFGAASRSRGSAGDVVTKRASRLLTPWLFFGLLHLAMAAKNHAIQPWMFVIGGSMHLWFVPFIFIATCAVALACRTTPWPKNWTNVAICSVAALALIHLEARFTPQVVDLIPFWQFLNGTTAVFVALAAISVPAGRVGQMIVVAALAALSLAVWMPWRTPDMMAVSPAAFGTLLFLVVAQAPAYSNRFTDFLGRASFGLYLMHPFVLSVSQKVAAKLQHVPPEQLSTQTIAVCATVTVAFCLIAIAVLERTPARRVVI